MTNSLYLYSSAWARHIVALCNVHCDWFVLLHHISADCQRGRSSASTDSAVTSPAPRSYNYVVGSKLSGQRSLYDKMWRYILTGLKMNVCLGVQCYQRRAKIVEDDFRQLTNVWATRGSGVGSRRTAVTRRIRHLPAISAAQRQSRAITDFRGMSG